MPDKPEFVRIDLDSHYAIQVTRPISQHEQAELRWQWQQMRLSKDHLLILGDGYQLRLIGVREKPRRGKKKYPRIKKRRIE